MGREIRVGSCERLEDDGKTFSDAKGRCRACHASKAGLGPLCRSCSKASLRGCLDERLALLAVERAAAERRALGLVPDRPAHVDEPPSEAPRSFLSPDELARLLEAKVARHAHLTRNQPKPSPIAARPDSAATSELTCNLIPKGAECQTLARPLTSTGATTTTPATAVTAAPPSTTTARPASTPSPRAPETTGSERPARKRWPRAPRGSQEVATSRASTTKPTTCETCGSTKRLSRLVVGALTFTLCPKDLNARLRYYATKYPHRPVHVIV